MIEPLTPDSFRRGIEAIRERHRFNEEYKANGGKPLLTTTPRNLRLAENIGLDLAKHFNIIRPLSFDEVMEEWPEEI